MAVLQNSVFIILTAKYSVNRYGCQSRQFHTTGVTCHEYWTAKTACFKWPSRNTYYKSMLEKKPWAEWYLPMPQSSTEQILMSSLKLIQVNHFYYNVVSWNISGYRHKMRFIFSRSVLTHIAWFAFVIHTYIHIYIYHLRRERTKRLISQLFNMHCEFPRPFFSKLLISETPWCATIGAIWVVYYYPSL